MPDWIFEAESLMCILRLSVLINLFLQKITVFAIMHAEKKITSKVRHMEKRGC